MNFVPAQDSNLGVCHLGDPAKKLPGEVDPAPESNRGKAVAGFLLYLQF